jgi:aspartyl-tRNA synthetase
MNFSRRTHTCGELNRKDERNNVTLNGWVSQIRDLGGVIFVNLRDRYGITQCTFNPDNTNAFEKAKTFSNEFVVSVTGKVGLRTNPNPNMPTGEIEVIAENAEVLNPSDTPPFVVENEIKANEDLRLKFRYLELRSDILKNNLIVRNEVTQIVHNYFHKHNFVEIETPILMKSTPEGARDYLVPSRVHKGKFYALPQSPQTYKQILMVAGFDRYMQLCKCFRDEDLRADRQPEFTQIDIEMSFVNQEDVFEIVEGCMYEIWKGVKGIELEMPFKRLTHQEAIEKYGIDKPDLRYGMEIIQITEDVKDSEFTVFKNAIESNGIVAGIKLKGKDVPRKKIDELTDFVKKMSFGGLGYLKYNNEGVSSPVAKFLNENILGSIREKFGAETGDVIFILSGDRKKVFESLGKLRIKLAEDYLINDIKDKFEFLWVTDFPLFSWNEDEKRFDPEHHPFTSPKDEYLEMLDSDDPEIIKNIKADCYDLVLNGVELGSGSIRIHKSDIQSKIFRMIGLSEKEAQEKFGFMLEAFKYGAPPHGGAAFGFDRIVALIEGQNSIKDFIAFPKTTSAMSLMDNSPGNVSEKQLEELGIKIR